ncbi:MAG TPA: diphosphate--fructose-6-phosphate 1-phosphotransferase [Tepidisphaeraceae bacterium]|nr:diphosphate--fructose-6-phosphate 1-phosphotransferase [Tepidisphaeraceae bacterium]
MSSARAGNLLVLQGGGPTPVFNASLYGVLDEARKNRQVRRIFGARMGIAGLVRDDLVDLSFLTRDDLRKLKISPGATLGSTREAMSEKEVEQVLERLRKHEIHSLIIIGGNGSMRAASLLAQAATSLGEDLRLIGVPKTIDNDILGTDRCPGYGSAARYVAQSVRDLGMDVRTLPQPVSIYETMGRNVGWLAAASVLANIDESHAPHLVYLPERPFEADRFLGDLDRVYKRLGWAVVVVPEGLVDRTGQPIFETSRDAQRDAFGRPVPGGVASHLADLVAEKLKIRCRWEKPGLCGRASALHVSTVDRDDAVRVGRAGVQAAMSGRHGFMIALPPFQTHSENCNLVPFSQVTVGDRHMPEAWLSDGELGVTSGFIEYIRPIVGGLVEYAVPLKDERLGKTLQGQSV